MCTAKVNRILKLKEVSNGIVCKGQKVKSETNTRNSACK